MYGGPFYACIKQCLSIHIECCESNVQVKDCVFNMLLSLPLQISDEMHGKLTAVCNLKLALARMNSALGTEYRCLKPKQFDAISAAKMGDTLCVLPTGMFCPHTLTT